MAHRRILGHSGNSITVTLPRDLLTQVGLWQGDRVELSRHGRNKILIRPDLVTLPHRRPQQHLWMSLRVIGHMITSKSWQNRIT